MTELDPGVNTILDQAAAELRSSFTLVSDPDVVRVASGRLAVLPHVLRAWQAIAWLSRRELPTEPGADLSAWLTPAHLALIPERLRTDLHATLRSAFAAGEAPPLWTERHAELAAALPRARILSRQLRATAKLVRAIERETRGRSLRTQRALRWVGRVAAVGLLGAGFALIALRPWQKSDEVGPWRAAYYPTEDLEGEPEVRREVDLDFDWAIDPPTDSIPSDGFSARFDTCLILDEATEVAFMLVSDDGSQLFVDGKKQIDRWKKRGRANGGKKLKLKAGAHHVRVEYNERRGKAELHLTASFDPEDPPAPIPAHMLEFPGLEIGEKGNPCKGIK